MRYARRRLGFTLVELLVVIAIIGVLIAMLLPAVESARESGRRAQCSNQVKQLGMACLTHNDAHKHLPTNGWGWRWVGDPDRGYSRAQPGGWAFNILPWIEAEAIRDIGRGQPTMSAPRLAAIAARGALVIPLFTCPSRRKAMAGDPAPKWDPVIYTPNYSATMTKIFHTDYAINWGDSDMMLYSYYGPTDYPNSTTVSWTKLVADGTKACNGIAWGGSELQTKQITDGLSKTVLIGEKNADPDHYFDGTLAGEAESMFSGNDDGIARASAEPNVNLPGGYDYRPPLPDTPGLDAGLQFGGAHPSVCNMVFCDGSVHGISFEINEEIFRQLCNRRDGKPKGSTGY